LELKKVLQSIPLRLIAYARSGDKGNSSNIGIIAFTEKGFFCLKRALTAEKINQFFSPLGIANTIRYELPNLLAFNFVLEKALGGGGSRSLHYDAQGKALGQALLEMTIELDADELVESMETKERD